MRPLSLTIQTPQPGERYDAQNEGAFRSEVVNQLARLPGALDSRYLQLDGGVLKGPLGAGDLTVGGVNSGQVTRSARLVSLPNTYVNVLQLGAIGSYRITVAGADNSLGPRSMGFYELMAVVSGDYMLLGTVTKHLEIVADGVTMQWAGVTGAYSAEGATLRMRTNQTTSNYWVVMVEEYTRSSSPKMVWLV